MPIIQEGVFEIPFAVDFSPEEYSEVLERGKNIASDFMEECIKQGYGAVSGTQLVDALNQEKTNPLDNPEEIRTFVVNKLLLEADAGDSKNRMRALELLGKVGEVGLFVEKKEVVHKNYKEEEVNRLLEQKIKELMHEKTIEAQVLELEEEADVEDAEFEEIEEVEEEEQDVEEEEIEK